MPSPLAHLTTGYLVSRFAGENLLLPTRPQHSQLLKPAILAGISLLPDLDAVPGLLLRDIGRFHNNASHSLLAGVLAAMLAASLLAGKRKAAWLPWFAACLAAYLLHIGMDLFTGERGVLLFWPLQLRFSAPVKLFYGVQWGLGLFNIWHLWTIASEILFFLGFFTLVKLFRAVKTRIFQPIDHEGKLP